MPDLVRLKQQEARQRLPPGRKQPVDWWCASAPSVRRRGHPPPTGPVQTIDAAPSCPSRIPIRPPGGRGDGPRAAGAGTGRWHRAAVSALRQPDPADFGHPEFTARRNRATGVQAACRRPGEVGARRRSLVDHDDSEILRPPPAHPHPRAGGRGAGRRAAERAADVRR